MLLEIPIDSENNLLEASHKFIRLGRDWKSIKICFTFQFSNKSSNTLFVFGKKYSIDEKITIPLSSIKPSTYPFYIDDSPILGHIQLPPTLPNNLSPDDIILQTNCSKWMGSSSISEWRDQILYIKKSSYNMIHWTPLQERGSSNSPYSLRNHLLLDKNIIPGPSQISILKETIKKWEIEEGMLSMIDLVWNHISFDSPLLLSLPEIAYNPYTNSPHLLPAFELDRALQEFSSLKDLNPIRNEVDVYLILQRFSEQYLPKIKLWEYWVIDVESEMEKFASSFDSFNDSIGEKNVFVLKIDDGNGGRFSRKIANSIEFFFSLKEEKFSKEQILHQYKSLLDEINLPIYQSLNNCKETFLKNICDRIIYERLDPKGPLMGHDISPTSPLTSPYFTVRGERRVFANNGWIWNADPMHNFAAPFSSQSNHPSLNCPYLNRKIIVWSDCVKLNYTAQIKPEIIKNLLDPKFDPSLLEGEEFPPLWEMMATYTEEMVSIFPAIRIDNCHSTPLFLGKFLLWRARKKREDLWVVAELFTSSAEKDHLFLTELGINSLIREIMSFSDWSDIKRGILPYMICSPFTAGSLLMDCTHDNEMVTEKFSSYHTLPFAILANLSSSSIGSTRGFDDIFKERLDIVHDVGVYSLNNYGISGSVRSFLSKIHEKVLLSLPNASISFLSNGVMVVKRFSSSSSSSSGIISLFNIENVSFEYPLPLKDVQVYSLTLCLCGCIDSKCGCIDGKCGCIDDGKDKFKGTPSKCSIKNIDIKDGILKVDGIDKSVYIIEYMEEEIIKPSIPNDIFSDLSLIDMNHLLYKCSSESKNSFPYYDCYHLEGWGSLPYAGFGSFENADSQRNSILFLEKFNENIQMGHWFLEYSYNRLPTHWKFTNHFEKDLPSLKKKISLIIPYIKEILKIAEDHCLSLMNNSLKKKDPYIRRLAMASVKLISLLPTTGIPGGNGSLLASMSAGLPHFTIDHWRVWGRDVFISLPGLLLRTSRLNEARNHIVAFASQIKNFLIPNLLDSAKCPRYNASDATFFFLYSLERFWAIDPSIMDECVFDGSSMKEIAINILLKLSGSEGIQFRDDGNDDLIREEGRFINIKRDFETSLLKIGNQWNCGTWMDKMGSSVISANHGIPATPRNGCPIEIISLLHRSLLWISKEYGIKEFKDWSLEIENNFKRLFKCENYYSDFYDFSGSGSGGSFAEESTDNTKASKLLRPNFLIGMAMNYELFFASKDMEEQSRKALIEVEKHLLGPLGIRTLDPRSPDYRPFYEGHKENNSYKTSLGFNYHNGPEWLWLRGLYISIIVRLDPRKAKEIKKETHRIIDESLFRNCWGGLPELTNKDGKTCFDSCSVQAWSIATFMDALMDIEDIIDSAL